MTANPNAGTADRLVCDCWSGVDHVEACVLGLAETIAGEALDTAALDTHPITAALIALTEAGILTRPDNGDEQLPDILMGLLDDLYEAGQLVHARDGAS